MPSKKPSAPVTHYQIGDLGNAYRRRVVHLRWAPEGHKGGKVLVLAHSGEIGQEIDAAECAPTGRSNSPQRLHYAFQGSWSGCGDDFARRQMRKAVTSAD